MSQSKAHRPPVSKNVGCLKSRPPVTASTNKPTSTEADKRTQAVHQRSKSKNKIPKNVRYDLENALVGLCDVWFEDIKPYLLRNNIKVHVNCGEPADKREIKDAKDRVPPDSSTACPHLDPGAAPDCQQHLDVRCVNYCSMPRTISSAPSRRRRVSVAPLLPSLPSPRRIFHPSTHSSSPVPRTRIRRKGVITPRHYNKIDPPCSVHITDKYADPYNMQPKNLSHKTFTKVKKNVKNKLIQTDNIYAEAEGVNVTVAKKPDFALFPEECSQNKLMRDSSKRRMSNVNSYKYGNSYYLTSMDLKRMKKSVQPHNQRDTMRQSSDKFLSLLYSNLKMDNYSSDLNLVLTPKNNRKRVQALKPWK